MPPLPFDLPHVSRGYAELDPTLGDVGARLCDAVARSLSDLLELEVTVTGRALPGAPADRGGAARVALELPVLPGAALLDVEAALVVRLVDHLAGADGDAVATTLTPVEASALELFVLAALDGACTIAEVEDRLAPRLARGAAELPSALALELAIDAGRIRGRARLAIPPSAVRALRSKPATEPARHRFPVAVSLRRGGATLTRAELDALATGDVVVLDSPADELHALVLPGGARLRGRIETESFFLEEIVMTERTAQLPVALEVELARLEVPLGDLARLEPGAILPLAVDRRGHVTLRLGDRAFARGELVDVEGAIGVRVLSLDEVTP